MTDADASNWYIAIIIERFCANDDKQKHADSPDDCPCVVYENVVLINAQSPDEAYEKAVATGKASEGSENIDVDTRQKGYWQFVGLQDLLPVYDKLEDGAELMWTDHPQETVKSSSEMTTPKSNLTVFKDD